MDGEKIVLIGSILFIVLLVSITAFVNIKDYDVSRNKNFCVSIGGEYYQTFVESGFKKGTIDEEHCIIKKDSEIVRDIILEKSR